MQPALTSPSPSLAMTLLAMTISSCRTQDVNNDEVSMTLWPANQHLPPPRSSIFRQCARVLLRLRLLPLLLLLLRPSRRLLSCRETPVRLGSVRERGPRGNRWWLHCRSRAFFLGFQRKRDAPRARGAARRHRGRIAGRGNRPPSSSASRKSIMSGIQEGLWTMQVRANGMINRCPKSCYVALSGDTQLGKISHL
ncbi:uncharacterized protein EI90DRAFT_3051913 [Cantharellus anzutake]|uniref:uncharacterized protein n=1 Tax=Cantharellus anzutake TaxID=1750568 RepID=UPI001904546D|nr:uncharacterized protein EI90DRAFT_3051913 [Cantharellus anzutake]KAF8333411.1 hypothetical protein EI90DRAFT_3051913 [Cantharellus anzutake]